MKLLKSIFILGLAIFFFVSGGIKVLDVRSFAEAIEGYRLIDGILAMVAAVWLAWIECLLAVALLWRPFRAQALQFVSALLAVFQIALSSALVRGLDISCGCFGSENSSSIGFALGRNCVLMVCILLYFLHERRTGGNSATCN